MHKEIEQKSNNVKKAKGFKWSSIFWPYAISFMLLNLGFDRLNDIKTKGYYSEYKYQVDILGDNGLITVYALIGFGLLILALSIYYTLKGIQSKK